MQCDRKQSRTSRAKTKKGKGAGVGLAEPRCQPSNSTHRRVGRAESAHADVSDGLQFARYVGALSDTHWKTRTAALNWTRCCTGLNISFTLWKWETHPYLQIRCPGWPHFLSDLMLKEAKSASDDVNTSEASIGDVQCLDCRRCFVQWSALQSNCKFADDCRLNYVQPGRRLCSCLVMHERLILRNRTDS